MTDIAPPRRPCRALARWAGVLAALLCLLAPAAAQLRDFPTLSRQFAPDQQPASYVIIIDMSGSMSSNGYFPAVRRAVSTFVAVLPSGDYLSILGFNRTTRRLIVPQRLQDDRANLQKLIASFEDPRPKRRTDPEQYTDIGSALEETVRELRAPEAPRVQFVFFLTDGKHDPGPGGKYPQKTGPAWDALRNTAGLTLRDKLLQVFALSLGSRTDAELVQSIFPTAMPVPVDNNQSLASFFTRVKSEMLRDRLKLLVANELRQNNLAALTAPRLALTCGKTSHLTMPLPRLFNKLDGAIAARTVSCTRCAVTTLTAGPTLPTALDLTLRTTGRDRFWQVRRSTPCALRLHLDLVAEPRAEILRLGLNPRFARSLDLNGTVVSGQPVWVLAICIGLLLAAALLVVRQMLTAALPPSLYGQLVCVAGPDDAPPNRVLRGYQRVTIGGTERDTIRLGYETQPALVTLRAERTPETWAQRLLSWRACSSQWIMSTGSVIIREPLTETAPMPEAPAADDAAVVDFSAAPLPESPRKARRAAKSVERAGEIGKRTLTNGLVIEIGSYTFRWDEHYDPKEEVGGQTATNERV